MDRGPQMFTVLIVAVVLCVAGCGSSKSSSSSISKPEFLAKANAICSAGNATQTKRAAALGNNPSQSQMVSYVQKFLVPNVQGQIDKVRALGAPKGDQATVTGFMNLAQADLGKLKAKPTLIATDPKLFGDFAAQAHAYGLTQCAKGA